MFQDKVGKASNTYEEKISYLDSHCGEKEKENIEDEISDNFDDYLENCGQKLVNLPSNTLCNIFDRRSKLLKNQKEKKKKAIQVFIISTFILLVSLICFYYFNEIQYTFQFMSSLPKYIYKNKEKIYLENVLLGTYYDGEGASRIKVYVYQNQTKYKFTYWNGNVSYSNPEVLKTWTDIKRSCITTETKVESKKCNNPYMRYYKYTEYKRDIITDPDGNISYGEWIAIRNWKQH